eukprot:TRINITY_DN8409_c0_g1_i1.p1 TRINITY_DN8409_c0_g1~~TRINITY_DN8409_c0_g1_i1.p1  ORF type:complete len:252 (-),score=28.38 TRINITY_DN8409_c0_g1_i1:251-1006(-)
MRKEEVSQIPLKNESRDDLFAVNGESDVVGSSRLSTLLACKDRDYLLTPAGNQVKVSELEGKVVGLYFSANWSPPCRNFTPVLAGVFDQLKEQGTHFEIVYVSSDEDSDAFDRYRATMPWLAVPFSDLESKKALNRRFDIEGIPSLVILQPVEEEGDDAVQRDGVELVYRYGVRAFPFSKEKLEELEKEEREKHENQTVENLLTNDSRDYLLAQPSSKQVSESVYFNGCDQMVVLLISLLGSFLPRDSLNI